MRDSHGWLFSQLVVSIGLDRDTAALSLTTYTFLKDGSFSEVPNFSPFEDFFCTLSRLPISFHVSPPIKLSSIPKWLGSFQLDVCALFFFFSFHSLLFLEVKSSQPGKGDFRFLIYKLQFISVLLLPPLLPSPLFSSSAFSQSLWTN